VAKTPPGEVREYLAEERPFLTLIRTSLALIGFGFLAARFSELAVT
jgi:uncharacterized membrane protein YidH (DUF202 family)